MENMRKIELMCAESQGLYWGQVAISNQLGLSDLEVRTSTRAISISMGRSMGQPGRWGCDWTGSYIDISGGSGESAFGARLLVTPLGEVVYITVWKGPFGKRHSFSVSVRKLPGYSEWLAKRRAERRAAATGSAPTTKVA